MDVLCTNARAVFGVLVYFTSSPSLNAKKMVQGEQISSDVALFIHQKQKDGISKIKTGKSLGKTEGWVRHVIKNFGAENGEPLQQHTQMTLRLFFCDFLWKVCTVE